MHTKTPLFVVAVPAALAVLAGTLLPASANAAELKRSAAAGSVPATGAGADTLDTAGSAPTLRWKRCPPADGEASARQLARPGEVGRAKAAGGPGQRPAARKECGTVQVPLDYAKPGGRKLTIAITRIRASDRTKRLGILVLNPGGPGGSGVDMPEAILGSRASDLGKRFDLIGFDPRGVNESTRLRCKNLDYPPTEPPAPANVSKEAARRLARETARILTACARTDPAFTRELTTPNVARDMDRIRAALGEKKLNYLGISWGTALGAAYRTQYGERVGRMVIDSPVPADLRLDRYFADGVAARQANLRRFAGWLADHHAAYGLGRTAAQAERTMARVYRYFTEHPQDVDGDRVDGSQVLAIMFATSDRWPNTAAGLRELKKVADRARRPAGARATAGQPAAPRNEPEILNGGVNTATWCNEETGTRDFEQWWRGFEERRKRYPLASAPYDAGFLIRFDHDPAPPCTGWPHPVRPYRFADTGAPLLIVAHTWESVTPGPWARDLRRAIGGSLFTVEDDGHGTLIELEQCAPAAVSFLTTGRAPAAASCRVPLPRPKK